MFHINQKKLGGNLFKMKNLLESLHNCVKVYGNNYKTNLMSNISYIIFQHHRTLSSPSHLLQTKHINHPLFSVFQKLLISTQTSYI